MHFFCHRFTGCCGCHDPGLGLFLGLVVESFVIFSSFGVLVCLLSLHLPYDKYIYVMVFLRLLIILISSFNLGISSVSWVQFTFSLSRGSHVCFPRLPFFVRLLTSPHFSSQLWIQFILLTDFVRVCFVFGLVSIHLYLAPKLCIS